MIAFAVLLSGCVPTPDEGQGRPSVAVTASLLRGSIGPVGGGEAAERETKEVCTCVAVRIQKSWPAPRHSRFVELMNADAVAMKEWLEQPLDGDDEDAQALAFVQKFMDGGPEPSEEFMSEMASIAPFVLSCEERIGTNVEF